jgi:hypothetical protein
MGEQEEILRENYTEYVFLAQEALRRGKFNGATTLFFKAIVALSDLYILKEEGRAPSSHADRFRIAEKKYPALYEILDRDFPFYQDSYTKKMDQEAAELLKEDAETIRKMVEA